MMNTARAALGAAALTIFQAGLAAELATNSYGRAGGAVGAERVQLISEKPGTMSFARQLAFDPVPGRAGGAAPAAVQIVARRPAGPSLAVAQWYGRAGYPLEGRR